MRVYSKYEHKIQGTGNLDCLWGADEIDGAKHICHLSSVEVRNTHIHNYR